jgi:hypothetical protein
MSRGRELDNGSDRIIDENRGQTAIRMAVIAGSRSAQFGGGAKPPCRESAVVRPPVVPSLVAAAHLLT